MPALKDGVFKKGKLKRSLGLFELTMYAVGIILGAGIYALIGEAAAISGNALWLAFVIGAGIATITGLSYAELGSLFPKEAAEYVYTKKAFNKKNIAFVVGWLTIFVAMIAGATVALGFGGYLYALTGVPPVIGAAGLIIILSSLNFWGVSESAKANILFTIIEIVGLLLIIFLAGNFYGSVDYFEMPFGLHGVIAAAGLIFFAYIGFEDIVNLSEETKKPRKNIPRALILSLIITTVVYVLVSMAVVSVVNWETLGSSTAPLADVAGAALPGSGFILSIIALFATANTVLILLIVDSRMIWGMANERALPKVFSKIHLKRHTPWAAILAVMLAALFFVSFGDIKAIAEITDFGVFATYLFVNAALIGLRYKKPGKRAFRVPLNIGKFPVLAAIGVGFSIFMMYFFKIETIILGIIVIVFGFGLFYSYQWVKKKI